MTANSVKKNLHNLKDKKAEIYRMFSKADECGYPIHTFYPMATNPLWCYTRQLTQDQVYKAQAYGQDETRLFVFNYYPNIFVGDYVLYRNTWYTITRVDTQDDYKGDLFIYVKLANGSFRPEDIKPYTPGIWNS